MADINHRYINTPDVFGVEYSTDTGGRFQLAVLRGSKVIRFGWYNAAGWNHSLVDKPERFHDDQPVKTQADFRRLVERWSATAADAQMPWGS